MHTLQQVLQKRVLVTAGPHESTLDAVRRMTDQRVGAIVILDHEQLVGIFSERDLMTRIVVAGRDAATTPVGDVMTREVVTARLSDRTGECEEKMRRAGCRHLPITLDGRVVAMLSMRDLLRDEIEEQVAENRELRAYIQQVPLEH